MEELELMKKKTQRNQPDKQMFEKVKDLADRSAELAKYMKVHLMEDRDTVPEDMHQCQYCTDFAFTSMIHCEFCNINYCISHPFMCSCAVPSVSLIYRYSNEELLHFLKEL
jgi:hypothetical protein